MIRYRLFLVRVCVNMIEYFQSIFLQHVRISHRVLSSLSMRNNTQQKIYNIFNYRKTNAHTHTYHMIHLVQFSVSPLPLKFSTRYVNKFPFNENTSGKYRHIRCTTCTLCCTPKSSSNNSSKSSSIRTRSSASV